MLHFSEKPNGSPVPASFQRGIALKGNVLCLCWLWVYNLIENILLLSGLHTQAVLEQCLTLLWSAAVCDGGTVTADRTRSHVCKVQQTPTKGSIYKNAATSAAIFLVHSLSFASIALPQFILLNATHSFLFSFWHPEINFSLLQLCKSRLKVPASLNFLCLRQEFCKMMLDICIYKNSWENIFFFHVYLMEKCADPSNKVTCAQGMS